VDRFYRRVVADLVREGAIATSARVLVVCGGGLDKAVLEEAGFRDVTISNVDDRVIDNPFAPFAWAREDAEQLSFADRSFDVVLVHAGLHHCRSPHRALLEMYRVARQGVLVIEARDSWAMRQACRLGIALDYEVVAVEANHWTHGGVENGPIPNYVYRWTEREVEKTIASSNPEARPHCRFFYDLELPYEVVPGRAKRTLLRALSVPLRALTRVMPSQGNCFGFWIEKPRYPADLQPWLTLEDGEIVPKHRDVPPPAQGRARGTR
jgi:SAM-dependent methyltransferase